MRPLIYGHPSREGLLHWDLRLTTHSVSPPLPADALRPWKHWASLTGQRSPPPPTPKPPPPGVPSSYLLNLLCPPWYGFRRPLSFGLHSGFFNYVVHFTCLCSFTPQDQGHERSHLIISKQEVSTRPHRSITSGFPICCSIASTSNKQCLDC